MTSWSSLAAPSKSAAALCASLCLAAASVFAGASLKPQVVNTEFPSKDVVVALLSVDAPKDGASDASAAIQAAIDKAAGAGGGVVFIPSGHYRLESGLQLKEGVTLRGDWAPPEPGRYDRGTVLMPVFGRGILKGVPAVTMERGTGVRELTVWYPEQDCAEPVPYPWTFRSDDSQFSDNHTVMNCTLVNPYQAVKFGPAGNELHTVRNVYACPLKKGLEADSVTDIGRIVDVELSPKHWEQSGFPGSPSSKELSAKLRESLKRDAVGVEIGRSDWEYIFGLKVDGYSVGLLFVKGIRGITDAVMFGSSFLDCAEGMRVEYLNHVGLSATGCRFDGSLNAVHATPTYGGLMMFNLCEFSSSGGSCVKSEGGGTLSLQSCKLSSWGSSAIEMSQGSLTVAGSAFAQAAKHVLLDQEVQDARLVSCSFQGSPDISFPASLKPRVVVDSSPWSFAKPDVSSSPAYAEPRPKTSSLFVVTDFLADPKAEDNAPAFAQALEAARKAGGGTVYVPAGRYFFKGNLTVPSGVELRGSFDVPHHTMSGGSVLMPLQGQGEADGTPFVQLEAGSGLRGLLFWYPGQNLEKPVAFPWTVRGLGPGCWLLDVTIGNGWQGVDLWSNPSDGHVVRYLGGCCLDKGIAVSKCSSRGWVEDFQFNPHYALRTPAGGLPQPKYSKTYEKTLIDYLRRNFDATIFGRCSDEVVDRPFVYAARNGLAFKDDQGGCDGRIINQGTDTGLHGILIEASGPRGLVFINSQPNALLMDDEMADIFVAPSFKGKASFFNTQSWLRRAALTAKVAGDGEFLLQQAQFNGELVADSGSVQVESCLSSFPLEPACQLGKGVKSAAFVANLSTGALFDKAAAPASLRSEGNWMAPIPGTDLPPEQVLLRTGWEPQDRRDRCVAADIQTEGCGLRSVSKPVCETSSKEAHTGKFSLRLAANIDGRHPLAYFKILSGPIQIRKDTVIVYWIKSKDNLSNSAGVDLLLTDGGNLRDQGFRSFGSGTPGRWSMVCIPVGKHLAGKTVKDVMLAYDSGEPSTGSFEVFIDDLAIVNLNP